MVSNFLKLDLNYLKNKGIYVLTALISVFLMVYIGFQIKLSADDDISVQVVDKQKISSYTELSGYIFMDEEAVVYTGGEYRCFPDVSVVGEYVDIDTKVATLYKAGDAEKAKKIEEIEKKIALLTECMVVNEGIIGSKEYDKDVQNAYNTIIKSAMSGNLFGIRSNTSAWLLAQGKKSIAVNYVADYQKEIGKLRVEKAQLLAEFGNGTDIKSPINGIYIGSFDGYEEYFSYETAKNGTYEQINSLLSGADRIDTHRQGETLCGKIIRSTKWYFAAPISSADLKNFSLGTAYEVEFEENNGMSLSLTLERILSLRGSNNAYVVFSCMEMPQNFEYIRFQNIRVKTAEHEGLCVPASSVRYVNGELAVYIAKSDKIYLKNINVITEYGGMYIVKPQDDFSTAEKEALEDKEYLNRYDTLIISGKDLYAGKYIDMSEFKD